MSLAAIDEGATYRYRVSQYSGNTRTSAELLASGAQVRRRQNTSVKRRSNAGQRRLNAGWTVVRNGGLSPAKQRWPNTPIKRRSHASRGRARVEGAMPRSK